MLSMQNYPKKKLSRIKNPFQSSQALDSNYSEEKSNGSPRHYDRNKLSNVFQFNDRSRVLLSDSQFGSEINNNNQSGENIYTFSRSNPNNLEKIEEIQQQIKESIKTPTFPINYSRPNSKYLQSDSFDQGSKKEILNSGYGSTNSSQLQRNPQTLMQPNTIKLTYQAPDVTMYKFDEKLSHSHQSEERIQKVDSDLLLLTDNQTLESKNIMTKEPKKTYKPTLFKQLEEDDQSQTSQINSKVSKASNDHHVNQPTTNQKIDQAFFFEIQRKSFIPKTQSRGKEQIQDENIDIFISPSQHQSVIAKDKQKAKILEEEKLHLSCGSSVQSYTNTILDEMRDKLGPPIEQIEIPFENSEALKKQINTAKNIVESKIIHNDTSLFAPQQSFKPNMTKKPRKKIFEPQSHKTTYHNSATNYTRTPRSQYSPYVSQFERERQPEERDVSPSQILMKSLNIIDKMAAEKASFNQNNQSKNQSRVVVVPPPPLTITQSQPSSLSVYTLSPEEVSLRKEILDLNFEVSLIESSFDLEKFDTKEFTTKLKTLETTSIQLFEKYKNLLLTDHMISMQSVSSTTLKQEILLLRQSTTELINFQEKYIQTIQILSSLEEEIKDILLLNSKEKYKKIKLLNEAIEVMEKTETYLSLQISKIPRLIRTFVKKEKILLEELRDWLKECINKQNSL